jgi:hypothetical protein
MFLAVPQCFFYRWLLKIIAPWGGLAGGALQVAGQSVAGDGAKCRRTGWELSQVCKKRRTCDGILLLWPICVAGDAKNADLRRFIEGPATWSDETCNEIIIFVP